MIWNRHAFIRQFSLSQPQLYRNQLPNRDQNLRNAAVLIGLVERDTGYHIILTQRAKHLRHHPGQISFPGGKVEGYDLSLSDTALRETYEEVGIENELIDVVGQLPPITTVTGFSVTPIVGIIDSNYELNIDHNEVAEVFEVPASYLFSPHNIKSLSILRKNRNHSIYAIPYQNYLIWGATAQIIDSLQRHIRIS
ncbi:CoA pyrophosphatase [Vibrio sp. WJH972]